jgi:hypothetical protein
MITNVLPIHLTEWRRLQRVAGDYHDTYGAEIEREAYYERRDEIRVALPRTLATGHMVWCRDGDVCRKAIPCEDLYCKHKACASMVVHGAAHCQRFQVTRMATNWGTAYHTDIYGEDDCHD